MHETCDSCGPAVKAYWELWSESKDGSLLTFCNHCWQKHVDRLDGKFVFKAGYYFSPLDSYQEYHAWSLNGKLARGGE